MFYMACTLIVELVEGYHSKYMWFPNPYPSVIGCPANYGQPLWCKKRKNSIHLPNSSYQDYQHKMKHFDEYLPKFSQFSFIISTKPKYKTLFNAGLKGRNIVIGYITYLKIGIFNYFATPLKSCLFWPLA